MKKIFYYIFSICLILPPVSLNAEPYCFVNNNGDLECVNLNNPIVGTGTAGGGGCGGSSACGNNNLETDWIGPYIKQRSLSTEGIEKFQKIIKEYDNKSIQLEISPSPVLR